MVENFDIKEEVFVLMTKKRLVSLMMSMGFILVALHNLGEKLSFGLQCLNLIGLCLFLFLTCKIFKDIR